MNGRMLELAHEREAAENVAMRAELRDLRRRAKLAVRYLRCVSSGQFVTASLVVAAIRTLEGEPLPLVPLGGKRAKRSRKAGR